jgi:hypothetical protein
MALYKGRIRQYARDKNGRFAATGSIPTAPDGKVHSVSASKLEINVTKESTVSDYVKKIKAGQKLTPVFVSKDPESGKMTNIVDGNHRAAAYKKLKMPIPVLVVNRLHALTTLGSPGMTPERYFKKGGCRWHSLRVKSGNMLVMPTVASLGSSGMEPPPLPGRRSARRASNPEEVMALTSLFASKAGGILQKKDPLLHTLPQIAEKPKSMLSGRLPLLEPNLSC